MLAYFKWPWIARTYYPYFMFYQILWNFFPNVSGTVRGIGAMQSSYFQALALLVSVDAKITLVSTLITLVFCHFFTWPLMYEGISNTGQDLSDKLMMIPLLMFVIVVFHGIIAFISKLLS